MSNVNSAMIKMGVKALTVLLYIAGTMLSVFNILAFTADKYGLYYRDENQWWAAIGISMLLVVWIMQNWKKL